MCKQVVGLFALIALAGCTNPCPNFSRCDIREHSCQQQIMDATMCLRGGSTRLPTVTVLSEDELLERFNAEVDTDDEGRAKFGLWNDGLALFTLAPTDYTVAEAVADEAGQTAAAYFENSKDIVVVDRGVPLDDETAVTVLTHEVVHALQDADYDLHKFQQRWVTDFDSGLAVSALIEGEAVTYQLLASAKIEGASPKRADWDALYDDFRDRVLSDALEDPAPVSSASTYFPYAYGGSFVTDHFLDDDRDGIDRLFEKPPRTTREILFGAASGLRDAQRTLADHALPVLPDSFEHVADTSLGAWIAWMYAAHMDAGDLDAEQLAKSVASDRFSVFADADAGVVAAWRVRRLPGLASTPWPGDGYGMIEGADLADHETYLIAGEASLPTPADEIVWRASEPSDQDDDGQAAAIAARAGMLRHAACNRPLRFRD